MPTQPRRRGRRPSDTSTVTRDGIVAEAARLTAEHGLDGWSTRQLAQVVGVWPTAITHHVGNRDVVADAVASHVAALLPCPDPEVGWRAWFHTFLVDGREVLRRYPGVARRLVLRGPFPTSADRFVDLGVRLLTAAGFGDEAVSVYNALVNTGCYLVAVEDDRATVLADKMRAAGRFADHDHADRPGLAAVADVMRRIAADPARARAYEAEMFGYTVERLLDGAQARLDALRAAATG